MSTKSYVKDDRGDVIHIRETSDHGGKLFEYDGSSYGTIFYSSKGKTVTVEVAEHRQDGSTVAYVPDESFLGQLLNGGKGKRK